MTKSTKTHHYTYIIRHINGRYYVGRRSTKKDPLLDPYMGSGDWVKKIKDKSTLTKTIIAYYDTFEELTVGEMALIDKYFDDVYCMNMMYSSVGSASGDKNHMYGRTGELSPHFGKKHTEITKQKMSDAKSGGKSCRASIAESTAILIKIRISQNMRVKDIAMEFNTTRDVFAAIKIGKTWKHIKI